MSVEEARELDIKVAIALWGWKRAIEAPYAGYPPTKGNLWFTAPHFSTDPAANREVREEMVRRWKQRYEQDRINIWWVLSNDPVSDGCWEALIRTEEEWGDNTIARGVGETLEESICRAALAALEAEADGAKSE